MSSKFEGKSKKLLFIGLAAVFLYAELGPMGLILLGVVAMFVG